MTASVIVWDIETVPDLRGFAAAKGLVGKPDDEVRAEMGDKFPKLIYHSIVCIGALVAQWREEHWEVSALGAHGGRHPLCAPRYQRMAARLGRQRGNKVARVDLARRLAEAIWHMLMTGQPFAPAGAPSRRAA